MKVELNLYASLKRYLPEETGGKSLPMELQEGTTVKELLDQLKLPSKAVKVVFLNGVHASGRETLKDGDRLGVFPPVAGG